jgi:hypothetical protein
LKFQWSQASQWLVATWWSHNGIGPSVAQRISYHQLQQEPRLKYHLQQKNNIIVCHEISLYITVNHCISLNIYNYIYTVYVYITDYISYIKSE